jgi:PAS domain S-box-containing protein
MKNENGNEPDALARDLPRPETTPANDLKGSHRVQEDLRGYEKVVEELDEMIVVVDRDYRYRIANRRFLDYRGLERDQVIGHFISEFLDPETVKTVRQKLDECFEGKVVKYELSYSYPGLGKRDLSLSYFPIEGPRSIDQVACILQDNTDRRRAEAESRLSKSLLHTVVEEIPDAVFVKDLVGRYQLLNSSGALYAGQSVDEIVGKDDSALLSSDAALEIMTRDREIMRTGIPQTFEETVTVAGVTRTYLTSKSVMRDPEGNTTGLIGIARDITPRKRAEEALREAEERYRKLADSFPNGVVITYDRNLRVTFIAGWSLEEAGLSAEFFIGKSLDEIAPPEVVAIAEPRFRAAFAGQTETYECPYSDSRTYFASVAPLFDGNGLINEILVIVQDITKGKRIEKDLKQSESQLAEAQRLANIGSWNWDIESDDRTWSDELYRIFGLAPNGPAPDLDSTLSECVHPGDREIVKSSIQRSITNMESWSFLFRIIRPDGAERIIHSRGNVVADSSGNLIRMFGTAQDVTERQRAEERLAIRARQQAVVAEVGELALAGADLPQLFDRATTRVAETFEVEYCKLLELLPDGRALKLVAGMGWQAGLVGQTTVGAGRESQAGFTLLSKDPVIVEDLGLETRFNAPPLLLDHGVVSGLSVIVGDLKKPFGVIGVHSTRRRTFTTDDVNFLQSVANVLAEAIRRKRTEEALRVAEQKYRVIFENAGEGIFQTTPEGQYIAANPALARMHGFESPEELISDRTDISHEVYVDPTRREEFKRLLELQGFVSEFEHQIFRQDGSKIWCSVNARAVADESGVVQYYEGAAQDITERKKAVAALRESEELFSRAFHSSPAPLIITRLADGYFLNANDAALRTFEYERAEVTGQTIENLNLYADPSEGKVLIDELRERGALREFESRARTKSGKILDLLVFVEPITLKGEQCLLSTAFDITDRKQVEAALRESEERYRELFENAKDAIYIHDLSGRYVSMNHAAEKLSGYPRDEILGKHFSNFVSPRDLKQVRRNLCQKLDIEVETAYEIELITKDRRRVPVEVVSRLIYENGKAIGVQGTARDISERKRAQEVLQIYSRRLMEAQEAERQSLARELHDEIGQVLTAVRINLQSIQRSGGTNLNISQLDESVAIVDDALGRVRELSIDLRPSLLDDLGLSAALRWYVDRYAQRTGIIAEVLDGFQDGGRLPRELETACFRIAQAALTNVARHARASSVSVQLERLRGKMLLTVIDDGVGFDLDHLRKNALAASALGLRGMEERALAVGGYIKIDSGAGRGTRVRAAFPLRRNQ